MPDRSLLAEVEAGESGDKFTQSARVRLTRETKGIPRIEWAIHIGGPYPDSLGTVTMPDALKPWERDADE